MKTLAIITLLVLTNPCLAEVLRGDINSAQVEASRENAQAIQQWRQKLAANSDLDDPMNSPEPGSLPLPARTSPVLMAQNL
jgi:hypothetical protein